jgi:cell division protease FtsH
MQGYPRAAVVSRFRRLNDLAKNVVLWIVIAVVLATVVSNFNGRSAVPHEMPYSSFLEHVKDGSVQQVTFSGDKISGVRSNGETFVVYNPKRTTPP